MLITLSLNINNIPVENNNINAPLNLRISTGKTSLVRQHKIKVKINTNIEKAKKAINIVIINIITPNCLLTVMKIYISSNYLIKFYNSNSFFLDKELNSFIKS